MSNDFKIVSIYDDDPSKSLPNVGIVDMDSRLPVHKGDEDYNATVQQLADAIHKPEIVEGSKTTDTIKKNTIFFLKNNSATINLTLSDAKITILEGTELVESTEKAAGFIVIVVNGSTKVHNVIYGATSWDVPTGKAKGFVWSGSTWTVASIDVDSIKSALGDFETLEVKNLSVTGSLGGDAVDTLLNSRLSMYTPIDTVLPMYKVYDANSAVGILQLPRILDKTWSVPRGSANLPPQESDYRIEFKSRYLVGGTSQSIQIAYATDDVNPNVYIRGCMYDTISEIWRFSTWRQLTTDTELTEILKQYPKVGVLDGRLTEIESTCVLYCTNCTDAPVGTEGFCVTFNRVGNRKQMFTKTGDNDWWVRSEIGNSWSDWKKLASTKSDVGLGNVNNTSDANKPISTATQTALNGKQATLVSGTNIKTINNISLLGSGNIPISSVSESDAFNIAHPIGEVYIQFPNQKAPQTLYGRGTWTDITSTYAGAFFRAGGGNASAFESGKQDEGLPNITGNINFNLAYVSLGAGGAFKINSGANSEYSGTTQNRRAQAIANFDANTSNSIYGASEHVTPENYTIKIWKRTA